MALRHNIDPNSLIAAISCESNFDPGAINHNKNGTTDKGLGQINSIHWKFFSKMGLDVVNNSIDNLEATAWLIEHHGMRDYKASEHCWSKKLNNFQKFDAVGPLSLPIFLAIR